MSFDVRATANKNNIINNLLRHGPGRLLISRCVHPNELYQQLYNVVVLAASDPDPKITIPRLKEWREGNGDNGGGDQGEGGGGGGQNGDDGGRDGGGGQERKAGQMILREKRRVNYKDNDGHEVQVRKSIRIT